MHRKTQTIIFSVFVLIFIAAGAYALASAFGFALDAVHFRIMKTGSISLEFTPREATLSLNGIPQKFDRRFLGRDVLVKNLLPGIYEVAIEAPERYVWKKTVEVCAGEVERISGIVLWPDFTEATSGKPKNEAVAKNVSGFWITGEGTVIQHRSGELLQGDVRLRGTDISTADPSVSYLVTKEGENRFLIDLKSPKAILNLAELFQSLKGQQLNLPGAAPLKWVLFHPFTSSKFILGTEHALYVLDTRKVALEKLAETTSTAAVAVNRSEAIMADRNGILTIANLVMGTVSREPGFMPYTPLRIASNRGGSLLFALTRNGTLLSYDRSTRATSTLGTGIADFTLTEDESRIAMRTEKGNLTVVLLEDSEEQKGMTAGTRIDLAHYGDAIASSMSWLPGSSRYVMGIDENGTLSVYETDAGVMHEVIPLAEQVADFTARDGVLYLLSTDGTLEKTTLFP